jgi:hypothetical protein
VLTYCDAKNSRNSGFCSWLYNFSYNQVSNCNRISESKLHSTHTPTTRAGFKRGVDYKTYHEEAR